MTPPTREEWRELCDQFNFPDIHSGTGVLSGEPFYMVLLDGQWSTDIVAFAHAVIAKDKEINGD